MNNNQQNSGLVKKISEKWKLARITKKNLKTIKSK